MKLQQWIKSQGNVHRGTRQILLGNKVFEKGPAKYTELEENQDSVVTEVNQAKYVESLIVCQMCLTRQVK